jgi:hypothetical protein
MLGGQTTKIITGLHASEDKENIRKDQEGERRLKTESSDMKLRLSSQNTTENTMCSNLRNNSFSTQSIIHPDDVGIAGCSDFAEPAIHKDSQLSGAMTFNSTPVLSSFNKAMAENPEVNEDGER